MPTASAATAHVSQTSIVGMFSLQPSGEVVTTKLVRNPQKFWIPLHESVLTDHHVVPEEV